jgi:hypothetical protein
MIFHNCVFQATADIRKESFNPIRFLLEHYQNAKSGFFPSNDLLFSLFLVQAENNYYFFSKIFSCLIQKIPRLKDWFKIPKKLCSIENNKFK